MSESGKKITKKKVGIAMPTRLLDALLKATGFRKEHDKRLWLAYAAAVMLFLECDREKRQALMNRLNNFNADDALIESMVQEMLAGQSLQDLRAQGKRSKSARDPHTRIET